MIGLRWRLVGVAVLAFAALVVGVPAGRAPLWDPNEARYMLLARDIVDRGGWFIPDLRGEPYLNKPQLFFWSIAVASLPGGEVTEWTAALPAVMSSIATVAAVCAIGARTWSPGTGTMAALALASTIGFFAVGHHAQSDVMVTAWTWWALHFLLTARRAGFTRAPLVGFYACLAGAIMSKGPMGLLGLAGGVVAIAATDGWRATRRLRPVLGLGVLAALLAPWYVTYLVAHGSAFVGDTVVGHYGSWVFRRGVFTRLESLWVVVYALPWTIFLVAAAVWWRKAPSAERRIIAVWTLTLWVLIGLSGIHRARYLIPIFPGLALLAAEFVVHAGGRGGDRALRGALIAFAALAAIVAASALSPVTTWIGGEGRPWVPDGTGELALLLALLVATAVAAVVAARRSAFVGGGLAVALGGEGRPWVPDGTGELALILALLVATAVAAVVAARRSAFVGGGLAVALGVGAILTVEGVGYPARFAREFDVRPIAAAAGALTPPGAPVAVYPDIWLTYDFYLRRPVVELDRVGVERLLAGAPSGAVIMSRKSWTGLQALAHPAWRVVAARRVARDEMVVLAGGGA